MTVRCTATPPGDPHRIAKPTARLAEPYPCDGRATRPRQLPVAHNCNARGSRKDTRRSELAPARRPLLLALSARSCSGAHRRGRALSKEATPTHSGLKERWTTWAREPYPPDVLNRYIGRHPHWRAVHAVCWCRDAVGDRKQAARNEPLPPSLTNRTRIRSARVLPPRTLPRSGKGESRPGGTE